MNVKKPRHSFKFRTAITVVALAASAVGFAGMTAPAQAASSSGCEGGGFTVLGKTAQFNSTVPAPTGRFLVQGKYVQFEVDPTNFAIHNYTFTGAANDLDLTGGRVTPVFESKIPDHRGLALTSDVSLELTDTDVQLNRTGTGGLSMKIQAKDCAAGGIFQMEPARGDGTRTRIVHRLGTGAFYFDNANFRAHLGEFRGSECTSVQTGPASQFCVKVTPRVNIGNDLSEKFVVRDSPQVATRILQPECGPDFTNSLGLSETRDHCGGMTIWDVASGGRMGMVTGEDATEVANPATNCTQNCQAQNQVKGRLDDLGFPFPVAEGSRLTPRTSTQGLTAALTP
ncbi:hypothetical protein [Arthrobacter cavernae]|uniref:Secreted protein n=1 Tax=Arthrobacter cavernae TaxID=2817681 RepID=A0A939KJ18_9MICC|nr:hypothetical protein [Arthrobacter cavernae]MBO1268197.1 hypothetical protein [Arthrobacter cavernae]